MTNCTAVDEEEDGGGVAFTVLIFVMICFIALSMGCTITVEALKEVCQHVVKAPLAVQLARRASSGRTSGS